MPFYKGVHLLSVFTFKLNLKLIRGTNLKRAGNSHGHDTGYYAISITDADRVRN